MARTVHRKETRAEIAAARDQASVDRSLYQRALQHAVVDKPYVVEMARPAAAPGDEYELRLYAPGAAHGGIVVLTYRHPGQGDFVCALYLEALKAYSRTGSAELTAAVRRVESAAAVFNAVMRLPDHGIVGGV